jgi:hypothetical protein
LSPGLRDVETRRPTPTRWTRGCGRTTSPGSARRLSAGRCSTSATRTGERTRRSTRLSSL